MAYKLNENILIGQGFTDISTTKKHPLGGIVKASDPTYGAAEFIYLKGAASTAAKDWVTYNRDDGSTTRLAANAIGPVAVAMAACTASYYGWYIISGKALAKCLTSFADNGAVFCTGTTAAVDDTSVLGDLVCNAKGASTTTADSGYAEFEIDRPFVNDRTANK